MVEVMTEREVLRKTLSDIMIAYESRGMSAAMADEIIEVVVSALSLRNDA